MECGKLTAKLRDAVQVCFIVNGMEVKRLKNIEIPDEIKKLPFTAFKFDVPQNGAITFKIMFEAGVLPAEWPEPRQRKQRSSKAVSLPNTIPEETATILAAPVRVGGYADAETVTALADADGEQAEAPAMHTPEELAYNVTGERRKALVAAVANYTGEQAIYQNAPTFAYNIGQYAVDKNGLLTGPIDNALIRWLADEGFITEE